MIEEFEKMLHGEEIGGRSTDLSQIGYSLQNKIREAFPINKVPEHIRLDLDKLNVVLALGETQIDSLLGLVLMVLRERQEKT